MSIETGVVIDKSGNAVYWHLPPGRTAGSLPEDRSLWEFLWENRETVGGFAHSHPGSGVPAPSWTDITTFAAIEAGLGKCLNWWICSEDKLILARHTGPGKHDYTSAELPWMSAHPPSWLLQLRELSYSHREASINSTLLRKMRACAPLLPPPGDTELVKIIDLAESLQQQLHHAEMLCIAMLEAGKSGGPCVFPEGWREAADVIRKKHA